jgi:hypothetical protein
LFEQLDECLNHGCDAFVVKALGDYLEDALLADLHGVLSAALDGLFGAAIGLEGGGEGGDSLDDAVDEVEELLGVNVVFELELHVVLEDLLVDLVGPDLLNPVSVVNQLEVLLLLLIQLD